MAGEQAIILDDVRSDLATFFGVRAERYLAIYDKMPENNSRKRLARSWNWGVFFGGFVWFFYRKLYLFGAILIVLPILMGFLLDSAAGATGMAVVIAMYANGWYVQEGVRRLGKADKLGLQGAERRAYLSEAGGVSLMAGIIAGILYAAFLALTLLPLFVDAKS